jgi:cytoskeletal protein CcmA (bactofilin family)
MIRMGRNSRTDETTPGNVSPNYPSSTPASDIGYQYTAEPTTATSRVVSDSESIARDIKEGRLSGFVGHGTTLTGDTNFQMMLRVDGHLTGTISSDGGTLIVGTQGQVDANISVSTAMINGSVNGDVVATEKIQLGRTARVIGNIQAPRLVLEDGAILEGGCSMVQAREAAEKKQPQTTAAPQYSTSQYSGYSSASSAADDEETSTDTEEEADSSAEAAIA